MGCDTRNDATLFAKQTVKDLVPKYLSALVPSKRAAFTLAEVLITLGIIGVVAAMTLPTLVVKYKQHVFSTAFKKQFSVLNNTINYLSLNEGLNECYLSLMICPTEENPNNTCYTAKTSDCKAMKDGLISNLKMTRIKKDFDYTKRDEVFSAGGTAVNRTVNYDGVFSVMSAYLLPDGAIVMFYSPNTSQAGYGGVFFVVDTNGKKAPNRWGYDVFWLTLTSKNDVLRLTDEYASISEKGGSLPKNILINNWSNEFKDWSTWK